MSGEGKRLRRGGEQASRCYELRPPPVERSPTTPSPNPSVSPEPEPVRAAVVAIDWADRKHFRKLCPAGPERATEGGELLHSPEAVDEGVCQPARRFHSQPAAVCLEQSRGALVCLLSSYSFRHLYPDHPATSASYRQTFPLPRHHDRVRRLGPEPVPTREFRMVMADRRRVVAERTRWSNALTAALKLYFPQALDWIDTIDGPMGCDQPERWPAPQELKRANPGTPHRSFVGRNSGSEQGIQERIRAVYEALRATRVEAMPQAGVQTIRSLVALLQPLSRINAGYGERIKQAVVVPPETPLFRALPRGGAGPAPPSGRRLRQVHFEGGLTGIAQMSPQPARGEWPEWRREREPSSIAQTLSKKDLQRVEL